MRRWSPKKLFDEHPAERPRMLYRVKRRRDGSLDFYKEGKTYRLERDEQAALVQWALNHSQDVMDAWENHIHFIRIAKRLGRKL